MNNLLTNYIHSLIDIRKYILKFVDCSKNWTNIEGKCFYISAEQFEDTKKTYTEALEDCKLRQGRLYEPRDLPTYVFLRRHHIKVG